MILDQYVKLKVTEKNISRAKIYQENSKISDEIVVPIEKLFFSERVEINVKCDICGKEFMINNVNYNINVRKNKLFGCVDCCKVKKFKDTCIKKYGVENPSYIKNVIEKRKITEIKNWGGHHMKNQEFFKKYKENNKIKNGYEMPFNSKEILEKCSKKTKDKYGVDNIFQLEETKNKINQTMFNKYGVYRMFQSKELKEKYITTMIERYGVDNPSKNEEIRKKVKNTKIINGLMFDESEWHLYKKEVRRITSKNKKELLSQWDGFDYYDNEYIKDNFSLSHNDLKYPTIDHKISLIEGYKLSISPEIIGSLNNLCYTKRTINSSKNHMTETKYKNCLIN